MREARDRFAEKYFFFLCAVSLVLVVLSLLPETYPSFPPTVASLLWRFTLGSENTVGSWWSGILLLLGALHAIDGWYRYRSSEVKIAWAWLIAGGVLLALSMDEVGSLHERAAILLPFGHWLSELPFALILGGGVTWALWQLISHPKHRRATLLMAIGMAFFVATAGQEYLEFVVKWPSWTIPIRMVVEEGGEIFGMLILIKGALPNSLNEPAPAGTAQPILEGGHSMSGRVLLVLIIAMPLTVLATASLHDKELGNPSDWLASALLLCAALAIWRNFLTGTLPWRWVDAPLALLCIVGSLCAIHIQPDKSLVVGALAIDGRSFVLAILLGCGAVVASLRSSSANSQRAAYVLVAIASVTVAFALYPSGLLITHLVTGFIGLVVYCMAAPHVAAEAFQLVVGRPFLLPQPVASRGSGELQFQLLEFAHDAVIIWETNGKGIQYWNPAAERMYGYSWHDARGKVTHDLLRTKAVGAGVSELEAGLARYGMWVGQLQHIDCNGELVEVESHLSLISKAHGSWLVLEVNRAISDRAAAEITQQAAEMELFNLRRQTTSAVA